MTTVPPLGPVSYALGSLTPTNFERLCWRLVRLQHPEAQFLDNPDGGVDTLLPAEDGTQYVRAWQAKRYTGSVQWAKCRESLDRAVATYKVPHVTFCFARNLTGPQEKKFQTELAIRHRGVKVDWLGFDELHALLTETREGDAVARFFFGAPFNDKEAIERAIALGGKLETADDALAHLRYVQGAFAHKDPYFRVDAHAVATGAPVPTAPDTVMSVIEEADGVTSRLDIAPHDQEAMRLFGPAFSIGFTDDEQGRKAREAFDSAVKSGAAARIEGGIRMVFDRLPKFMEQLVGKEMLPDILEMSPARAVTVAPRTWAAELSIKGQPELGSLAVDLAPDGVPAGWDACLRGKAGGTEVRVLSRWRGDRGEMNFRLRHVRDGSAAVQQAVSLRLLRALSGGARLLIADRVGSRPTLEMGLSEKEAFSAHSAELLDFLEDLALIEERSGLRFVLPESLDQESYMRIRELSRALRSGEIAVTFEHFELEVDAAGLEQLRAGWRVMLTQPALIADILGQPVHLRGFVPLEPYEVRSVQTVEGRNDRSLVTLSPPQGYDGGYVLKVEAVPVGEVEQHVLTSQKVTAGKQPTDDPK